MSGPPRGEGLRPEDHDAIARELTREDRERDEQARKDREAREELEELEEYQRESEERGWRSRERRPSNELEQGAKSLDATADKYAREGDLTRAAENRAIAETYRRIVRERGQRAQRMILGGLLALAGTAMTVGGLTTGQSTADPAQAISVPAAAATAPAAPVPGNRPPRAGAIVAVLQPPTTTYVIEAVDDDGDTLTYRWDSTNKCDSFTFSGRTATWRHQHPPCNENEPFHPGIITVVISDGRGGEVTRTYPGGSASGTGPVPPSPSPSPVAATTERPSTPTPSPSPTPAPSSGGGPSFPLVAGGLLLLGGGLGLLGSGWRMPGGPIAATPRTDAPADPCAKEKAAEAAARARRDVARQRRQRIRDLRAAHDAAQRELERATREDAASKDDRSVSWGEDAEIGRASRIYTNPDQRARIARAEAALAAARAAAEAASHAYEGAGNGAEDAAAQQALDSAEAEWQQADAALRNCLQLNAPPPPPPPAPTPSGGGTATGGGTTTGGGTLAGPVAADPGTSTRTRERTCVDGEVRSGSERVTTREFTFAEIHRAQISLDAVYPGAQYVQIDEFIDWMNFTRRAFKAGKAIKGLAGGELLEGTLDTIDYSGVVDVPDFLTFWDKMSEAVLNGLKQTSDIFIDRFSKLGDYSLRYTRRVYTAHCRTWEQCEGGAWVRKKEFSFEVTRTDGSAVEGPIAVHDKREIAGAIDRLFTSLQRKNQQATRGMEAFERECGQ